MKKLATLYLAGLLSVLVLYGCANAVEGITLDKRELTVENGAVFTLTAAIVPNNAKNQTVVWNTDSDNVLAVTSDHTLQKEFRAAKIGSTNIKVFSSNEAVAICKITVVENAEDKAVREKAEEEDRLAEEKATQESKTNYDAGITYHQLARTPNDYIGKEIKLSGKVLQVMEGPNTKNQLRLAVDSSHDTVLYAEYSKSAVETELLEDDYITLYGTYHGIYTYEAAEKESVSVPSMIVDIIDQ